MAYLGAELVQSNRKQQAPSCRAQHPGARLAAPERAACLLACHLLYGATDRTRVHRPVVMLTK